MLTEHIAKHKAGMHVPSLMLVTKSSTETTWACCIWTWLTNSSIKWQMSSVLASVQLLPISDFEKVWWCVWPGEGNLHLWRPGMNIFQTLPEIFAAYLSLVKVW